MPSDDPSLAALVSLPAPRVWSVLVTLFGDLAQAPRDRIDGPLLTRLTEGMGIRPEAVRVALHRLRNDEWITSIKSGRTASHALTPHGRRESQSVSQLIYAPIQAMPQGWQMAVLPSNDPELRTELLGADFVPVLPRLFVAHGEAEAPGSVASAAGQTAPAWLADQIIPEELTRQFVELLAVLRRVSAVLEPDPTLSPVDIALRRCLVVHHWRRLVLRFPYLPPALTGADWPGHLCRAEVSRILARLPRPELDELMSA